MADKKKSQFRTVGIIMIIMLSGKALGLLRDMMMSYYYGTGMEAQAFLAASRIPRNFFDAIFASAISSSFIPVFNEQLELGGQKEAYKLSNSFITVIGLLTAALSVLGVVFSDQVLGFLVDGYTAEALAIGSKLLKILFPTIFFTGIAYSLVGILQSQGSFNIPAAISTVSNGIIIAYYVLLNDKYGVTGLAVAYIVGWAAQVFIQIPPLRRLGYRYRPSFGHPGLKKIFVLMLPVMVSTWIQPINLTVSTKLASRLIGGVASIEYANALYTIVAGVLVLSVVNVIFPDLSKLAIQDKKEEFAKVIRENTSSVLFLLIPMTVGMMVLSEPIIRLFYERGEFTAYDTINAGRALMYTSLGIVGYGLQTILSRAFYAMKNGRVPLISGIASIAVNAGLAIALVDKFDVAGIGIASSIALFVAAVIMVVPMHRITGGYISKAMCVDFFKMLVSSAIMGAVVIVVRNGLLSAMSDGIISRVIIVALPAILGVIVYMVMAKILRLPQTEVFNKLLGKFKRRES